MGVSNQKQRAKTESMSNNSGRRKRFVCRKVPWILKPGPRRRRRRRRFGMWGREESGGGDKPHTASFKYCG